MFVIENQLLLLILFFLGGCAVAACLLRIPAGSRAWIVADLAWVVLGGFGALGAVLAGIYKADSTEVDRRIDLAYVATAAFDRDAARFRLHYCEAPEDALIVMLCEKADFLSASTAENADLPLFIAITRQSAPLQSLNFFGSGGGTADMMQQADRFPSEEFLVFTPRDADTARAIKGLRRTRPAVVADFTVLADSYEALTMQVQQLRNEWALLRRNAYILVLQIMALCLVSFAAPIRLGKTIAEFRGANNR